MLRNLCRTIAKHRLFEKNDALVIGVSGGPDSVALLYALHALKNKFKLRLHVAHLDHMLRKGARQDSLFVKKLSAALSLPLTIERAPIRLLAKKKGSLEEIARDVRLRFFFKIAKKIGAKKICLGHTRDDQAETVLMRILRGSGLYGLSGILPKRMMGEFEVVRPLIETTRREVSSYLKRLRVVPRNDSSNACDIYFRNRVRNRLIPLLEKGYSRNIKYILSVMAETVGSDYDYLLQAALKIMQQMGNRLSLEKLCKMHPALRRILMRMHIARVSGDLRRLTFKHIAELEDLLFNRPINSRVDLPKGVSAIKKKAYLKFYKRRP